MPEGGKPKNGKKKPAVGRGAKKRSYLDSARQLFAEFGYSGASLDQIAESAGVTRAMLARTYPDKPTLLRAIGEEWVESLFPEVVAADKTPIAVVNQMLAFSDRFFRSLRDDRQTAQIVLTGLAEEIEEEESTILHDILQAIIERLLPIIVEGQQSGVIRRDIDARNTAGDWVRFSLGAALLPFRKSVEGDAPMQFAETILHGILKTDV
jgi:AcrR family transcriptional regulator